MFYRIRKASSCNGDYVSNISWLEASAKPNAETDTILSQRFPELWICRRSQVEVAALKMAVEAYGELGPVNRFLPLASQSHLIGPVLIFEAVEYIKIELGWLMDVNACPRYGDMKINVEIEF